VLKRLSLTSARDMSTYCMSESGNECVIARLYIVTTTLHAASLHLLLLQCTHQPTNHCKLAEGERV
jgi:hypothetical protein